MTDSSLKAVILDKRQLAAYFSSSSVSRPGWRTGMECEVFAVRRDTLAPVPFYGDQGIEAILKQMARDFGWSPVFEGPAVIGLNKGACRITLEPGGQIELSSTPHLLISKCIAEREEFISQLQEVVHPMGIGLMYMGYHPNASLEDAQLIPKARYRVMWDYFGKYGGELAHHMMKLTTSVQASIDYEDEADFSRKIMLASYLTPVLQAIYANSPFRLGTFSGSLGFRGVCWENTDKDRCGLMEKAFRGDFTFEDYTDFLLGMPMIVRFDEFGAIPMEGTPFIDYVKSRMVTMEEWHSHVSFAFPEIRLRNYIELRMCDSVPGHLLPTIPAILKGLLYDGESQAALVELFRGVSVEEALRAYAEAHRLALRGKYAGRKILDLAREIVTIAYRGLGNLGREGIISVPEEQALLNPLQEQLWGKGMSPAEELLELWEAKGRDLLKLRDRILI